MSSVLVAMGLKSEFGMGTVRLSVGVHTTLDEVTESAVIIAKHAVEMMPKSVISASENPQNGEEQY